MNFLPVADRELRLLARRPQTYFGRAFIALVVMIISLGMLYAGFGGRLSAGSAGRGLFIVLACCAAAYVLLDGGVLTADCLSREKRDGTLGLLFLTDLRGYDIVAGKLVSRTAGALYGLLAAVPTLGIALFLGGVTGSDFVRMMLALLNGLFFSASWGMFVSALGRRERRVLTATVAGVMGLAVFLPAAGWVITFYSTASEIHPVFLFGSPAGAFWHVLNSATGNTPVGYEFASALGCSHAVAWMFLFGSSWILSWTWREDVWGLSPVGNRGKQSRGKGRGAGGSGRRRRWLEANPIVWVGDRRGEQGWGLWPLLLAFGAAGLLGWLWVESTWFTLSVYAGLILVTHLVLAWMVVLAACRGPAEDRQSGLLEILLTTPVGEDVYLQGRMLLIKRRCLWPVLLVLVGEFGLMVAGCWQNGFRSWDWLGWIAVFIVLGVKLVLDLYAASWVGLWQALKLGSTALALRKTLAYIFALKWVLLLGLLAMLGLLTQGQAFNSAAGGVFAVLAYIILFVAILAHFCGRAMSDLRDHLRIFVAENGSSAVAKRPFWKAWSKPPRPHAVGRMAFP